MPGRLQNLLKVMKVIGKGKMPIHKAAQLFGITYSTLYGRIKKGQWEHEKCSGWDNSDGYICDSCNN